MHVRVIESGNHHLAAGIDGLRAFARQRTDRLSTSHGDDLAAQNGNGLRLWLGRGHCSHVCIYDYQLGDSRKALGGHRKKQNKNTAEQRHLASTTMFPSTTVVRTFTFQIFTGLIVKMSSERITKSASLPGSLVPCTPS